MHRLVPATQVREIGVNPPCALAHKYPEGSTIQCKRCLAVRRFWQGYTIVPSVFCDGAGVVDEGVEILRWRRIGER